MNQVLDTTINYHNKEWLYDQYIKKKKTLRKIGKEQGVHHVTIFRWLEKFDIPIRKCVGKDHGNWKGGRQKGGSGYIAIHKPGHPRAHKNAVLEHVLVMEKHLKRHIWRGERIHHLNGIKTDNKIKNLVVCTNKTHGKIHASLEKCGFELFKRGIIAFDTEKKEYYINE